MNIKVDINERENRKRREKPKAGALRAIKLNCQEWITRERPR